MSDPKDKDYTQAIKESYDPSLQRLRVDAIINDGVDALVINPDGSINVVASGGTSGGLTDTQLRASPVPVSGPLTDTELRATAVPISGTVAVSGTLPVSGPLTDTQLRATAVPISGSVSVSNLPVTQPISGTVSISGTVPVSLATAPTTPVTGTFWQATQPVSGPLTDTQLRATPVPISGTVTASSPTPEKTLLDEVSDSVTYVGAASAGTNTSASSWQLKKISVSGTVTTVAFADGNTNYDNTWDDRASYTYS
jgi:hypothetical protein